MAIRIEDDRMTSDEAAATARRTSPADTGGDETWTSTRCPGATLTRSQAISSLVLAEVEAVGAGTSPRAAGLRAELGL